MNSKKIFSFLFSGLLAMTLASCDFGSDESDKKNTNVITPEQQEAQTALYKAMAAISAAQSSTPSAKSVGLKTLVTETYSYTGPYWSATGTYQYDNPNIYPMTYDMTFTWTGYTYNDVTLSSGTVSYYLYMTDTPSLSYTYSYSGSFVLIYNGTTYNVDWDIDGTSNGSSYTYSGTYTVNGTTYSWNNAISY